MAISLSSRYADFRRSGGAREASFYGLTEEEIAKHKEFYRGKVRDLIFVDDRVEMVHSDRLTAFDRYIDMVPYKGIALAAITKYWFDEVEKAGIIPTHMLGKKDQRTLLTKRTKPIKVEVIVRGYLAGSLGRLYESGRRDICGIDLPEDLKLHGPLPHTIVTPTTKAEVFEHDEEISAQEVVERGICSLEQWNQVCSAALALFDLGTSVLRDIGWILVDTKYEFGLTEDNELLLIDEIHTPDSSRFWDATTYEERIAAGQTPRMFDKEIVRRYLLEQGFSGEGEVPKVPEQHLLDLGQTYLDVAERLMGKELKIEC